MRFAIPYLIVMLILAVLALTQGRVSQRLRDRMWLPCGVMLLLFFGLRGFVGDDWMGYKPVYDNIKLSDIHLNVFGHYNFRYEPGFALLAYIVRQIGGRDGFFFFQFVVALLQLTLLIRFLRRYADNLPFSLIVFLAMSGIIMLINMMRNTLAILIFLNGLHYITERRPWPYFITCVVAMSFHISSLLFIPLYFFLHRSLNKWAYLTIFVLGNLVVLLKVPIFSMGIGAIADLVGGKIATMVNAYIEDSHMAALSFTISIGYLERVGTGILIFLFWDKLLSLRRENAMFINAMVFYFFFYFFFSEIREVGHRLGDLFIFGYWILWPDFFKCFPSRLLRFGWGIFLAVYCTLKVIGTVGYAITRYENVLTGYTEYRQRIRSHKEEAVEVTKAQQGN